MNQVEELIASAGTPLYVFDAARLAERAAFLRSRLPENVSLCFAMKANPFLLKEMVRLTERIEICSPGEMEICRKAGIPSRMYVVSGVHKDREMLRMLAEDGLADGLFTVESAMQYGLLEELACAGAKRLRILIRLSSGNQFGMDEAEVTELVRRAMRSRWLVLAGIQYFSGTQKGSIRRQAREIGFLDAFLQKLEKETGFRTPELEFGPGFPVAYFTDERPDEEAYLAEFSRLLNGMAFRTEVTLEVGRSLAASCGTYYTRVADTKTVRGENYAVTDGGMHQIVYYGHTLAMKHPHLHVLGGGEEEADWTVCGSLCTANDVLVRRKRMPALKPGSVLAFENAGAYCMTEGISLFLSRDLPAIAMMRRDGTAVMMRGHVETAAWNAPVEPEEKEYRYE